MSRYVLAPRRFDHWEVNRENLRIYEDEKLGSGAFGAVYKGINAIFYFNKYAIKH